MQRVKLYLVIVMTLSLAACGGATLMSAEDEARIGAAQHPKIIAEFGGVYDNPKLTAYVEKVMARIQAASDAPDQSYRITILDTPIVNAFALPGGYTYITRGLLALANNEAELAGVIGHEIAHVTARHSARRHTASVGTAVVAGVLGAVINAGTGVNANLASDLLNAGGGLLLAGYSRENEYEADNLGIQALARAGYQPQAQADFLAAMGAYASFKTGGASDKTSWFATHPNNKARVKKAREKADAQESVAAPHIGRAAHLAAIDGMVYGDGPAQGIVKGRRFAHADLRLQFEVPRGFQLQNAPHRVTAVHANNMQIIFDLDERVGFEPLEDYMQNSWAAGADLTQMTALRIDGRHAVSGEVKTANGVAFLLAIADGETRLMRFGVIADAAQADAARLAMKSLQRQIDFLNETQTAKLKPLRLRVVTVQEGDTLASVAGRMGGALEGRIERLRVLNHLTANATLKPGQSLKTVSD